MLRTKRKMERKALENHLLIKHIKRFIFLVYSSKYLIDRNDRTKTRFQEENKIGLNLKWRKTSN